MLAWAWLGPMLSWAEPSFPSPPSPAAVDNGPADSDLAAFASCRLIFWDFTMLSMVSNKGCAQICRKGHPSNTRQVSAGKDPVG